MDSTTELDSCSEGSNFVEPVEIVGHFIDSIFEVLNEANSSNDFRSNTIVVLLDTGISFSLNPYIPFNLRTGLPRWRIMQTCDPILSRQRESWLHSPIKGIVRPFEWDHSVGLELLNGMIVHEGFAIDNNGVVVSSRDSYSKGSFENFEFEATNGER